MNRVMIGLVAAVASLLVPAAAGAQPLSQITRETPTVGPETFPIYPWDFLPPDLGAYREAKECGFNLAGFVLPGDLDAVREAGLKCFVSDPLIQVRGAEAAKLTDAEIAERAKAIAAKTAGHPAVFGYHVLDEPVRSLIPLTAKWAAAIDAAVPNGVAYVNFLPIYGMPGKAKAAAFEEYLTAYINAARPKAFSTDHYAMMDDGSIRPNFFQGMEVVSAVSRKTGVPFWNVCLANSHFHYAEPSAATLRFQVYASLAYGARGIGWFTYTGRDRGNYHATAIDLAARRTPTWAMLRDANLIAHRLAPTCVTLKSVGVFYHPDVPPECHGVADGRWVAQVQGEGPFLVGEFETADGRPAIMVVNRNLQRSTQVTVKLKAPGGAITRVSGATGKARPVGSEDNWIEPGGGVLYLVQPPAGATGPAVDQAPKS